MGWRRDEVWFDIDVLWTREQPRQPFGALALEVPAAAGALEPRLFGPVATGLEASRRRRLEAQAARKRRFATRTVPAVALVLGSASMFSVSALRQGSGGEGVGPLQEDPPSLTYRFELAGLAVPEVPGPAKPASSPKRALRTLARAAAAPKVEWNRATSVGLPFSGRLVDGTQLPVEGPDWVTWNPNTESVPNLRHRLYGNERTIRAIVSVLGAHRAAHTDAPRVVVGDISLRTTAVGWISTSRTRTASTWTSTTRDSTGT